MPGERTEQATQHRREEARKEGDVLHSRELSAATGALAGVMVLGMLGSRVLVAWRAAYAGFLALGMPAHWEPAEMEPTLYALRRLSLAVLGPPGAVMAAVAAASLGVGVMQTGGINFYAGAIGFKPDRINPVSNLKNLFSLRAAARLAKSLIPASVPASRAKPVRVFRGTVRFITGNCGLSLPSRATATSTSMVAASTGAASSSAARKMPEAARTMLRAFTGASA